MQTCCKVTILLSPAFVSLHAFVSYVCMLQKAPTRTCVQPSCRALCTGTGSNTAASTSEWPLNISGGPVGGEVGGGGKFGSFQCMCEEGPTMMGGAWQDGVGRTLKRVFLSNLSHQ